MTSPAGERTWPRPLGLLFLALALATGQPFVLIATAFGLLILVASGGRVAGLALAAVGFALAFSGPPADGFWYMERGWAIVVAGFFTALSWGRPEWAFFERALLAVAGAGIATAGALMVLNGWPVMDGIVTARLESGALATLQLVRMTLGAEFEGSVADAVMRTAGLQARVFPALAGLTTLASLGVAWWMHQRLAARSGAGLGSLREFRFPDALVWVLIVGVALVLVADAAIGWGRLGLNLLAFMSALYVLRGAGVLLFLAGGPSFGMGLLVAAGLLLAGPVVVGGAAVVGLGDTWLDLRARVRRNRDEGLT